MTHLNFFSVGRQLMNARPCSSIRGAAILTAVSFLITFTAAHAANITWSEVVVDTTDSDTDPGGGLGDAAVSTVGTLIEAGNFGILDDVTVNGVLFKGVDFSSSNPANLSIAYDGADNIGSFANGGTTTGGSIDALTASFGRDAGVSSHTAQLTGLTVGQQYLVQFIASFARLNRTTTFEDGNGNSIVQSTNNPHAFANGTFVADGTTQTVNMTISAGSQFLSGYQLRAVPEPSSLMLLALGGMATAGRRRRV
jgi:hypothetical protein